MSHIFISYSRKDLAFAQKIVDALGANDLDTWIDWKSIPKGEDWEQEIYRGIEEADAFLFLISPVSVTSEMCNKEIKHAVLNGKRILPIFIADIDNRTVYSITEGFLTREAKEEINRRNFIFCRESRDDFDGAVQEIQTTIHTDYEWLKYHTELQVKALRWEKKKDVSRLLRGKELREAEQQLVSAGLQKNPHPTDLQRQYLLKSQRNELQIRRQIIASLVAGLVLTLLLSFIAITQRNSAIEKERIARAGELAAMALSDSTSHFDRALLFGVESLQLDRNSRSLNAMSSLLQLRPEIIGFVSGGSSYISTIKFSPDGNYMISGGCAEWQFDWQTECVQGEIVVRDISNLAGITQRANLSDHDSGLANIDFSPDGKLMISGDWEGDVILWDMSRTASPQKITQIYDTVPVIPVAGMAINTKDSILAVAQEQMISLFDISNRSEPIKLTTIVNPDDQDTDSIPSEITEIFLNRENEILISVSNDGNLAFWDLSSLTTPALLTSKVLERNNEAAFNAKRNLLALGGEDQSIYLWDISDPLAPVQSDKFTDHKGVITSLTFSPDNNTLASGGTDGKLILWDVSNPHLVGKKDELAGHSSSVESIAFDTSGTMIASGDFNKTIILWDIAADKVPLQNAVLTGHDGGVNTIGYSMDGKTLVSGGRDHTVKLWDTSDPTKVSLLTTIDGNTDSIASVALSPDGVLLAAGDAGFNLSLWNVSDFHHPSRLWLIKEHKNTVKGVAFTPEGRILVSSGGANVLLWDISLPDGPLQIGGTDAFDSNMIMSSDGRLLAVGNFETDLWDISDLSQPVRLATLEGNNAASLAMSPDKKLLAVGGCLYYLNACIQGRIILWDISNPSKPLEKKALLLGTSIITALAISPDGRNLAAGFGDEIVIWNIADPSTPIQQIVLSKNIGSVQSLVYNFDGTILVSGDLNGNLILWNMNENTAGYPNSWVDIACWIAGRNFSQSEWKQYFPDEPYHITCPQYPGEE